MSGKERTDVRGARRGLTPREAEVLAALARGWSVPDIARHGVVSVATVRSQIRSILAKLEVGDEAEAIAHVRAQAGGDGPSS
jgi:DNA-binding NarL/FixJ family response regulator